MNEGDKIKITHTEGGTIIKLLFYLSHQSNLVVLFLLFHKKKKKNNNNFLIQASEMGKLSHPRDDGSYNYIRLKFSFQHGYSGGGE